MKWTTLLFTALFAVLLTACGEKETTSQESAAPQEGAVSQPAADAPAPAAKSGGGYEPSESERVPGITMSQEELDKIYAETRATTPMPEIPGEAK